MRLRYKASDTLPLCAVYSVLAILEERAPAFRTSRLAAAPRRARRESGMANTLSRIRGRCRPGHLFCKSFASLFDTVIFYGLISNFQLQLSCNQEMRLCIY